MMYSMQILLLLCLHNLNTFKAMVKLFQDRKVLVKSFKTYIAKICREEYGHMVLLVVFDVVDDTKLVQKAILEVR